MAQIEDLRFIPRLEIAQLRCAIHRIRLGEPGVLRFCLFQDGHVGVGVFPESEEIVIDKGRDGADRRSAIRVRSRTA